MDFVLSELCEQVMTARAGHRPLIITGGASKHFYGNVRSQSTLDSHYVLDMTPYRGIVSYHPSELVVTVRAGTPLLELQQTLAEHHQMLAFEPPHFDATATIGGCVASGLAGPRRVACGGIRDFVLGTRILDAQGRVLTFGGEVMKNVAGYDVSRLMVGSLGIFAALLDVSLKVVPQPAAELTLMGEASEAQALAQFAQWRMCPLPISASAWLPDEDGMGSWMVRLSGAPGALKRARATIGGQCLEEPAALALWSTIREHTHSFFQGGVPLWRFAVKSVAAPLGLGPTLLEWGGSQRWFCGRADVAVMRAAAAAAGGHVTLFRANGMEPPIDGVFQPMEPGVAQISRRLKQELDPVGLFNPSRLVLEL